jgi:lipopolysaccharide/colanic/teichoic acid biosynthesis glycosyltransferase
MPATSDTTYDPAVASPALQQRDRPLPLPAPQVAARLDDAARRAIDVIVSAILLLLLLPASVIAMILVKLDSPGPAFYRAQRVGYKGRELRMLKFRKMSEDAAGPKLTSGKDQRLTRIGVWLTRLKLDEIPQLWHVFTGEMSLVGPRPEDPEFVDLMKSDYETILQVRPGITGYSQLAFAEESNILDPDDPLAHYLYRLFPQKLALDKMYAGERSLWLNARILCWTVAAVILRRSVAVNRKTGAMNLRMRRRKPS